MDELISVIIPTYKRGFSYLKRALTSVLNQSYKNIEVIVVDDNEANSKFSKEISAEIYKLEINKIKYIKHESNLGACAARNTGIQESKGNYIAFLDDDDRWLKNKLELQMKKMHEHIGLVYCDFYFINIRKNIEINREVRKARYSGFVFPELLSGNFIGSTSFPLIKSCVFKDCGLFNTDLKSAQDYELWLRIAKKYEVSFVGEPLVEYYNHDGERITTNPMAKINGDEQIIEMYYEYLIKNRKIFGIKKSKLTPYYYKVYGYRCFLKKIFEAFKIYPNNIILYKIFVKITFKRFTNYKQ